MRRRANGECRRCRWRSGWSGWSSTVETLRQAALRRTSKQSPQRRSRRRQEMVRKVEQQVEREVAAIRSEIAAMEQTAILVDARAVPVIGFGIVLTSLPDLIARSTTWSGLSSPSRSSHCCGRGLTSGLLGLRGKRRSQRPDDEALSIPASGSIETELRRCLITSCSCKPHIRSSASRSIGRIRQQLRPTMIL